MAAFMGTSQPAVSELESGLTEPRLSTLARYAEACGAEIEIIVKITTRIAPLVPGTLR